MKPFIKLIKTLRGYYFYDVNRNMFCRIEKNQYIELENVIQRKTHEYLEEIKLLYDKGWLSEAHPQVLRNPYTSEMKERLKHDVNNLILQVTLY